MHISEGVLSPPVLAAGWTLAAGALAVGLKKTPVEKLPETALVSAALFLASLVHVPLGPSSIHLTLLGLAGMLLGWSVFPALFIALFLQGLLFQFGGLLSLGVNTAVMGTAALAGYYVFRVFRAAPGRPQFVAAFCAGFAAVITGTVLVCGALFFSDMELKATATLLFAANLPLAAVEGIVSAFITAFLARIMPRYVS
ncbi:MAG: cobalt transporter CbiM [Treponema sp.]|jgi:cobalt/nickel transport system permease protein|nr:cobalt transporter CbiM [Treponema sp.]